MTPFAWKCVVVCGIAFLLDLLATWHFRAIVKADMAPAVSTLIAMHFLGLVDRIWIIDHPQMTRRLWLTAAGSLGAGLGCTLILLLDL